MKLYHTQHIESLEEKWWNQNPDRTVCEAHQYDGRFSFWNFGGIFIVVPLGQFPLLLPPCTNTLTFSGVMLTVLWMYVEFIFYRLRDIWDVSQIRAYWRTSSLRNMLPFFLVQDVSLDMPAERAIEAKKNQ